MAKWSLSCEARRAGTESITYKDARDFGLEVTFFDQEIFPDGKNIRVRVRNTFDQEFLGVIHIQASAARKNPKFFLPGYLYGRNTAEKPGHGRKEFPRIREGAPRRPESSYFMTRSDRLAEPLALLYDDGRILGLAAAPYWVERAGRCQEADPKAPSGADSPSFYQYCGFTCRIGEHGFSSVGYTLGYENAPWLFIQTATVKERAPLTQENAFRIGAGEEISFSLRVYDYEAESELGIYQALIDAYDTYHQPPRRVPGMTVQKAAGLLADAVSRDAWLPDDRMYSGFVYDTPGGYTYNKIGSLTWTNGMSVAAPMLLAANRLGRDEMRAQALTFIDEVVSHSLNPASGLLYDAVNDGKWSVRGWWYDGMHSGGHSSYLNGQALYYLLKSYLSEKRERGVCHEEWLSFAAPVLAKLNRIKNTDGEYPFSMSEQTGAGLEYDSLGGVWCLAATALYCLITGERGYLEGLRESEQHYYDFFVKKAECYGGPLDTDKAVDDEGILAYVRAARILHELTGEEKYLEHLRDGLYYETSFKLGYNTPVKVRPLCEIGWSSCGGSITSTANPHIHPMSSTIIDEMLYFTAHAQDDYLKKRLKDTLLWGLQTFNTFDKEYGYGRIGWMSERFCFCEGLIVEKYLDGTPAGTWFALMPWAAASVIEGFVGDAWELSLGEL